MKRSRFPNAMSAEVQAGDLLAFYGQGIPVDTGVPADGDILSYPASAPPSRGTTITLGADPYPIYSQDRTYSFAASVNVGGATEVSGGIRKFVDALPLLPVAVPDTITHPGSDYYEIALREYDQQMHSDLPPTRLRGYVQTNSGTDGEGHNTIAPAPIQYMGPTVIARRDRPVRIKFVNELPTGDGGRLFLPVDKTTMGAGPGPESMGTGKADELCAMDPAVCYTENRSVIHLHGNNTVWISDGSPHQWITPAGEASTSLLLSNIAPVFSCV